MCLFAELSPNQSDTVRHSHECSLALAGADKHVRSSKVLQAYLPVALTLTSLTILGNLTIACVLRRMELRGTSYFLFRSLAITDVIFMSAGLVFGSSFYVEDRAVRTVFSKVTEALLLIPYKLALWISVLITVEKVYHMRFPIRAKAVFSKGRIKIALAVLGVWIVVTAIPDLVGCHLASPSNNATSNSSSSSSNSSGGWVAMETILYRKVLATSQYLIFSLAVHYVLPILLIFVFNVLLVLAFRDYKRQRSSFRGSNAKPVLRSMGRIQRGLFTTVLVVTLSHCACVIIPVTLAMYEISRRVPMSVCALILRMALSMMNAATNMAAYTVCIRRFREGVRRCFCPSRFRKTSTDSGKMRRSSSSS